VFRFKLFAKQKEDIQMASACRRQINILNCFLLLICPFALSDAWAEITTDGTLGSAGQIAGPNYTIGADLGQQMGGNLFHSFGVFNVGTGETATFAGPASVENIISRVTGGTASLIDGKLRSEIAGANLYLLNPAGVIFGAKASLEISGAFHVSTAEYVRLGTGGRFDASRPENSVLATAAPDAFGFLGENPKEITVGGTLMVPSGKTLSATGGDIKITGGNLVAMGGRIDIASVAAPAEVTPTDSDLKVTSGKQGGSLLLSGGSKIDVRGDAAGGVYIRCGRFEIKNSGSSVYALTGNSNGGKIDIRSGDELALSDSGSILTATLGSGRSGDVAIETDRLNLTGGAMVISAGYSSGRCGNLSITANESVAISGKGASGSSSGLYGTSSSTSTGDVGGISLTTGVLTVTDSGAIVVETGGTGHAGDISIKATQSVTVAGTGRLSANSLSKGDGGSAGDISVSTGVLTITDNGLVASESAGNGVLGNITLDMDRLEMTKGYVSSSSKSSVASTGSAGSISVTTRESVHIAGSGLNDKGVFGEYYGIYAQTQGAGDGGHITIKAGSLTLTKDAMINGQTYGGGRGGNVKLSVNSLQVLQGGTITVSTRGKGDAGDITINARDSVLVSGAGVKIDNSWIYTATHSGGAGGDLSISTPELIVAESGVIYANTLGDDTWDGNTLADGPAGKITLDVDRLNLTGGGAVSAGSESAGLGGNIEIAATESIAISGSGTINKAGFEESGVYAWAKKAGNGGKITISTGSMTLSGKGQINTSSSDTGTGGNISLQTHSLKLVENASISAKSSGAGDAGAISINTGDTAQLEAGAVTTEAENADGGNITLNAVHLLRLVDSKLTATVRGGLGNGGNISIDPKFVILKNSKIIANAYGGKGGNIRIVAEQFLSDQASIVQASSQLGIDGTVEINAPDTDVSGSITVLPETFLDVTGLLQNRCAARTMESASSLIITGRGGMPAEPDDFLPTTLYAVESSFGKKKKQNSEHDLPDSQAD